MQLVIAEKPLLGKAIADAIPGKVLDNINSVITKQWNGDTIKIAWCFGHLLELKRPEDYDAKYKQWRLEDLPIYFPGWSKQPPSEDASKKARVQQLGRLLKDASMVIHAGDVDDEGQSIVDELLDYFSYKGKVMRLDTRDITPGALQHALTHMDDNAAYRANGVAAYSRQVCDALFGFNLSRYYTLVNSTKMVIGRVQTPALGLVVRRDLAIAGHAKQLYYTLYVDVLINGVKIRTKFIPSKDDEHLQDGLILDRNYLLEVAKAIASMPLPPSTVSVTQGVESPPLPFNTTKLNSYCGSKWGMSPAHVLSITQSLRDSYKAISYNRSECRYLSMELHKEASGTISVAADNLGLDITAYGFDAKLKSKAFDDSKVGTHMGIIPTNIRIDTKEKFNADQMKVYEAIVQYYLAQFLPPAKMQMTKLVIEVPKYGILTATALECVEQGYRVLLRGKSTETSDCNEDQTDEESDGLKKIRAGQYTGSAQGNSIKESETKPPPKYTQSTLEEDMTRIARYCENQQVKTLLLKKDKDKTGENGSIGTSATRPAIIAGLITHGLLQEVTKGKKKYIEATAKGRELYAILPDNIRGVDVTAKWWCLTEDIKTGKYTPEQMAQNVLLTVNAVLSSGTGKIEGIERIARGTTGECLGKCPKCGGDVFENAKGYACTAPGCRFAFWKDDSYFKAIGKHLTPKTVAMFLAKGRVGLKNCKTRSGHTYDAIVVADFSGNRVHFAFDDSSSKQAVGKCPKCGADVFDKGRSLSCSNESCKFVLWKSSHYLDTISKTLSTQEALTLMITRKLEVYNVKSKTSKKVIKRCLISVDLCQSPPKWNIEFLK